MTTTFSKPTQRPASLRSQRGMSMTAILVIMSVVVFFATFAMKAGPAYMDNWTVMKVVDQVSEDDALMRGSKKAFYKSLNQQLGLNNLWTYKAEDIVELKKASGGRFEAKVSYEKRENLFSNIDLVMRFEEEVGSL